MRSSCLLKTTALTWLMALPIVVCFPQTPAEQAAPRPDRLRQTLVGHSGAITTVAFSPDGKALVSGDKDGAIIFWDAQTGIVQRTLTIKNEVIRSVAFSPDGQMLVSGSLHESPEKIGRTGTVTLWHVQTGEAKRKIRIGPTLNWESKPGWVFVVACSPDGKWIAGGVADGTTRIWEASTGKERRSLGQQQDKVNAVAFSPDGLLLVSASDDGQVILWDTQTWKAKRKLKPSAGPVRSVVFSPDGKLIVTGSYNMANQPDVMFVTNEGQLKNVDNETTVIAPSAALSSSAVKLWEVETGELKTTLAGSTSAVLAVAFSPDGQTVAHAVSDNTVRLVEVKTGALTTLRDHKGSVITVAFSPDGRTLASAGADRKIRLWHTGESN